MKRFKLICAQKTIDARHLSFRSNPLATQVETGSVCETMGPESSADAPVGLEHQYFPARFADASCGGEPRHAGADHDRFGGLESSGHAVIIAAGTGLRAARP